ncbi:hypothetical protein XELAEV_18003531mg, partial [Xenopus laevis]
LLIGVSNTTIGNERLSATTGAADLTGWATFGTATAATHYTEHEATGGTLLQLTGNLYSSSDTAALMTFPYLDFRH